MTEDTSCPILEFTSGTQKDLEVTSKSLWTLNFVAIYQGIEGRPWRKLHLLHKKKKKKKKKKTTFKQSFLEAVFQRPFEVAKYTQDLIILQANG